MYATVTRNMVKRKRGAGTWFLETTTMFKPGEDSVAEETYKASALIEQGKARAAKIMFDHRWGEVESLEADDELVAAIEDAFGDAMAWNDLRSLVNRCYDTRTDPAAFRRFFLNAQTSTSDAWVAAHEWEACARPDRALRRKDLVCLGLDGSVDDDATALVACRVSDGHLQLLACWERPEGAAGDGWRVDTEAVDAAVANAMATYEVVGFYLDPPHWKDYADLWHNEFAAKMKIKASAARPLDWWTNRPRAMVPALERFHEAIIAERLSYTPATDRVGREAELTLTLQRHVLNARRRPSRAGLQIGKEFPHSPRKIDAAVAAVLAYTARGDAVAAGVKSRTQTQYAARRIR
jgi:hypothetical protein